MDAYSHRRTIPAHLITKEYFEDVKNHLKPRGIVVINIHASVVFRDNFSIKIDNTLREVFYPLVRQALYFNNEYSTENKTPEYYV